MSVAAKTAKLLPPPRSPTRPTSQATPKNHGPSVSNRNHLVLSTAARTASNGAYYHNPKAADDSVNKGMVISQEGIKLLDDAMAKKRGEGKTAAVAAPAPAPASAAK